MTTQRRRAPGSTPPRRGSSEEGTSPEHPRKAPPRHVQESPELPHLTHHGLHRSALGGAWARFSPQAPGRPQGELQLVGARPRVLLQHPTAHKSPWGEGCCDVTHEAVGQLAGLCTGLAPPGQSDKDAALPGGLHEPQKHAPCGEVSRAVRFGRFGYCAAFRGARFRGQGGRDVSPRAG